MKRGEVVQLEIPSSPEYVAIARQAVEGLAKRLSFNTSQIEDIKIAVGEACTNAVKHGSNDRECCTVEIRCKVEEDGLMIEIRNSICDCQSPRVPEKPDTTREGGYGLYLIQSLVDEVDLRWGHDHAVVRLLKRRSVVAESA